MSEEEYKDMDRTTISEIRVGSVVAIPGSEKKLRPCKLTSISKGKTGKHGAAKAVMKANDIITDKHYEFSDQTSSAIWLPKITRRLFKVTNVEDNFATPMALDAARHVTLFDEDNGEEMDLRLFLNDKTANEFDFEMSKRIETHWQSNDNLYVVVLFVMDETRIIECKIEKDGV